MGPAREDLSFRHAWSRARWQVFGLAGSCDGHADARSYRAPLPRARMRSSALVSLSFPLTAAGQLRIPTGFPLSAP
ncbi:MAG: hypothetical protein RLZZ303_668 [Candidatus Hydrogenedentota bacterium]